MECPTCKEIMFTIEFDGVEVDCCGECRGIWLDTDELDLLLGDHALTEGFLSAGDPAAGKAEKPRPCPLCDSPMRKSVTGGAKPIVHDYCPKGHGTWFDAGELQTVIEQGTATGPDLAVARWLREIFPST